MSQGNRGAESDGDRRRHYRAGVCGGAVIRGRGLNLRGNITNLWLGGALIDLPADVPQIELDHEVVIEMEIGGGGWIAQRGYVRRHDARQLAIAFGQVGPEVGDVIEDE